MAAGKKLQIDVCLAVEAGYWFGDVNLKRTGRAIKKLYKKLFSPSADNKAKKRTAQSVWFSIIENPQAPEGPLTLAAISQAMLLRADFSDKEERAAFVEFVKHNTFFQQLFRFFIFEQHSDFTTQQFDHEFRNLFEQVFSKPIMPYEIFPDISVKEGKIPLIPFSINKDFSGVLSEVEQLKNIWVSGGKKSLREKLLRTMKKDEVFVFELLQGLGIKSGTLMQHLKQKMAYLIEDYCKTGADNGGRLYALLSHEECREQCVLTPQQLKKLLERETSRPGEERCFNSRFEAIIARDDNLYQLLAGPDQKEAGVFESHYPWLHARFQIDEAIKTHSNLNAYLRIPSKKIQMTTHQAYLITANPGYWNQIDPYVLNPISAFFNWLNSNWFKTFFEEEKNKLNRLNPLFNMRLEWESDATNAEESFEEWVIQAKKEGLEELVADIAQEESLVQHSTFERRKTLYAEALLKNPCRFDAFFSQINTPELATAHEKFLCDDDVIKLLSPKQVSRLMRVDGDASSDQLSCAKLAEKIMFKKPQLIVDMISKPELRKEFSKKPDALLKTVASMIQDQRSFLSDFLDCMSVVIGQYNQKQLDEDFKKLLLENSFPHNLTFEELTKIQNISPASIEFILSAEKFKTHVPVGFSTPAQQDDQSTAYNLALAKQLSGAANAVPLSSLEVFRFVGGQSTASQTKVNVMSDFSMIGVRNTALTHM